MIQDKISILKFLWKSGPFHHFFKDNIPQFLESLECLKDFSSYDLAILSQYLFVRDFEKEESIFNQEDLGIGMYFIFSGKIKLFIEESSSFNFIDLLGQQEGACYEVVLQEKEAFGELALLQKRGIRHASAMALEKTTLLGLYRPDLEKIKESHPKVALKIFEMIAHTVTDRLILMTELYRKTFQDLNIPKKEK